MSSAEASRQVHWSLEGPFALSLRSLALARIAIGATVLLDLALRLRDFQAHYTYAGVLPLATMPGTELDPRLLFNVGPWRTLAPHNWSDAPTFQGVLFALTATAAASVLVGWRTRWATALLWLLLSSLHARNPLVLNGGDDLLRCVLFWCMFLPWGDRLSLDSAREVPSSPAPRVFSVASVGLVLQVAVVFFLAGLLKSGREWSTEGTALGLALQLETYRSAWGHHLLAFEPLLPWVTRAVRWVEIVAPLLLLVPVKSQWFRRIALLLLGGLLAGIALGMRVGLYPWIAAVSLVALLPTEGNSTAPNASLPRAARLPLALLLVWLGLWSLFVAAGVAQRMPAWIARPVEALQLDQRWDMFSPAPPDRDATMQIVDESGAALPISAVTAEGRFTRSRWRKLLLERFARDGYEIPGLERWLCGSVARAGSPRRVTVRFQEIALGPGGRRRPLEPKDLLRTECTSPSHTPEDASDS